MEKRITANLTVKDIITVVKWKSVKLAIKYHYPTDHNNYEKLFYDLAKMSKVKVKQDEFLEVCGGMPNYYLKHSTKLPEFLKGIKEEMNDTSYGINMIKPKDTTNWAISFIPWKKLVNMPISHDTLFHYSFEDIIAHFIWEITFYGSEKEMEKQKKIIFSRAKEVNKKLK